MDDVPLLVHHFLAKHAAELGKEVTGISQRAMDRLLAYPFPGNVRELENITERAVALSTGAVVDVEALPPTVLEREPAGRPSRIPEGGVDLEALVADFERSLLREALERTGGVKKRAARLLGISFRSFRYRLEKLGLDGPGSGGE